MSLLEILGKAFQPAPQETLAPPLSYTNRPILEDTNDLIRQAIGLGVVGAVGGLVGWALFRLARSPRLVRGVEWPGFPQPRTRHAGMRPTHRRHSHRSHHRHHPPQMTSPRSQHGTPARPTLHDCDEAGRLRQEIGEILARIPHSNERNRGAMFDALAKRIRAHSQVIGLPSIHANSDYYHFFPPWHYRLNGRLFHWEETAIARERRRLGRRFREDDYFPEITLPLRQVVPLHPLTAGAASAWKHESGSYLNNINELRGMIVLKLLGAGWEIGTLPSAQMMHGAFSTLGWKEEWISVFGPTRNGSYLLRNGHHRIAALITLVADGILPAKVLDELRFLRSSLFSPDQLASAVEKTFHRKRAFPFSWKHVLAFHSRYPATLHRLGIRATLQQIA